MSSKIFFRCSKGEDLEETISFHIAAVNAGSTTDIPIIRVPVASKLKSAFYIPSSAISAHATNYMTLKLINKGTNGSGTTELGSRAFNSSGASAFVAVSLLSSVKYVSAGDVISFQKTEAGTGMALPEGVVVLTFAPRS